MRVVTSSSCLVWLYTTALHLQTRPIVFPVNNLPWHAWATHFLEEKKNIFWLRVSWLKCWSIRQKVCQFSVSYIPLFVSSFFIIWNLFLLIIAVPLLFLIWDCWISQGGNALRGSEVSSVRSIKDEIASSSWARSTSTSTRDFTTSSFAFKPMVTRAISINNCLRHLTARDLVAWLWNYRVRK